MISLILIWYVIGLITCFVWDFFAYRAGENRTIGDLKESLGLALLGPILPIIIIANFLTVKVLQFYDNFNDIILIKGKRK